MKFSICNELFKDWKNEDVFQFAGELGYDGVEIAPFTLNESVVNITASERKKILAVSRKNKVKVAGLHWLLASPPGMNINSPDKAVREKTRLYFLELVRFCSDIGGSVLVFGSPNQRVLLDGVSYPQAWQYTKDVVTEAAQLAKDKKVTICLEPLATSFPNNFLRTPAEAVKMIEEINLPNVKLILDSFSCNSETIDMPAAIRKYRKHLAHVHVNDDNKGYPGSGNIDFKPIAKALKEINYKGYVSTEVFLMEDPKMIARNSMKLMKKLFAEKP